MSGVLPQIALVAALVIINAAFAGSELALVSLREGQLQRLERQSATGRLVARLAREPNQFLATIQIGITLAGFLASASAAVSLAQPLEEPLGFLGGAAEPAAIVVVTIILSYVTLVFGELAPKRIAMQRAERWSLMAVRPLAWVATLTRPAVWVLSRSTDLVVRVFGGDPNKGAEEITEEELRQAIVEPAQLANGAIEDTLVDRLINDVMAQEAAWQEARAGNGAASEHDAEQAAANAEAREMTYAEAHEEEYEEAPYEEHAEAPHEEEYVEEEYVEEEGAVTRQPGAVATAEIFDVLRVQPLMMELDEWRRAGDVFTIELADMADARELGRHAARPEMWRNVQHDPVRRNVLPQDCFDKRPGRRHFVRQRDQRDGEVDECGDGGQSDRDRRDEQPGDRDERAGAERGDLPEAEPEAEQCHAEPQQRPRPR